MDATTRLLKVFQVEKQMRELRSRLESAERFLAEQDKDLAQINAKRAALEAQAKALMVQAADREGEAHRLDAKIATIREQMGQAQTNREYQAFLVEMNTHKLERDKLETTAIEFMQKVDEAKRLHADAEAARDQRLQVRQVAQQERDARHAEIAARLAVLKAERAALAAEATPDSLKMLEDLLRRKGEDAMATIQVEDRKRHEYTCGSCQMTIPVEAVSGLLSRGVITRCVSCQCLLFLDETARNALQPPASSKR
ncbi:MAG: hypothetical protein SFY69_10230 [Planctomycetota bacterium]|nr:hypothetical protein [Planctomycetota bacterium]